MVKSGPKLQAFSYEISHGDAMLSVATIGNATARHVWKLLRESV